MNPCRAAMFSPPFGKEYTMNDEKIQTGLRIPLNRYNELKEIADRAGISLNAVILLLVEIGMAAVNRGVQEADHVGIHNLQHTDGQ